MGDDHAIVEMVDVAVGESPEELAEILYSAPRKPEGGHDGDDKQPPWPSEFTEHVIPYLR